MPGMWIEVMILLSAGSVCTPVAEAVLCVLAKTVILLWQGQQGLGQHLRSKHLGPA